MNESALLDELSSKCLKKENKPINTLSTDELIDFIQWHCLKVGFLFALRSVFCSQREQVDDTEEFLIRQMVSALKKQISDHEHRRLEEIVSDFNANVF